MFFRWWAFLSVLSVLVVNRFRNALPASDSWDGVKHPLGGGKNPAKGAAPGLRGQIADFEKKFISVMKSAILIDWGIISGL